MEIHEIRYFLAVCECLNFTRAAERCNVSQPALTRAIKNLEDKLDAGPLIHRERANTHLTELGWMMKPYFEHMLENLQEAAKLAKAYSGLNGGSLTLGIMCTIGPSQLVDLFTEFNHKHAGLELLLVDASAAELEDRLEKGELDIAISCNPGDANGQLHELPLYDERFVIAVAPGHPLASRQSVRLIDLNDENYLCRKNCEYRDYVRQLDIPGLINPQPFYSSERDDWIQYMALAGLGYSFIPEYAVAVPGLKVLPLVEPEITRTVSLFTVRGRPHSAAVGAFIRDARAYTWKRKQQDATGPLEASAA